MTWLLACSIFQPLLSKQVRYIWAALSSQLRNLLGQSSSDIVSSQDVPECAIGCGWPGRGWGRRLNLMRRRRRSCRMSNGRDLRTWLRRSYHRLGSVWRIRSHRTEICLITRSDMLRVTSRLACEAHSYPQARTRHDFLGDQTPGPVEHCMENLEPASPALETSR